MAAEPKTMTEPKKITLSMMRSSLYSAVVCDALDQAGYRNQSPRLDFRPYTGAGVLVGRAKTTLWVDMAHDEPDPYALELAAVDSCKPDDVFVAATAGSTRSAIWGELLTTAASRCGCVGAIVDGGVRDIAKVRAMNFPVFARSASPYDSQNRQRVVNVDVRVEIGGVQIEPGDLVVADEDGVVVIPRAAEEDVIRRAWEKVHAENRVRDAIREGMSATAAYEKYGVL